MASERNVRNLSFSSQGSNSGIMEVSGISHSLELKDKSASTPLSPSSSYAQCSISNVVHSFTDAVVFCHWDNILGPRLEHVWYISDHPQPHINILRFITTQILSGEICREVETSSIGFKFFDIPDKGVVIPSFVFSAQRGPDLGLHALALVIPNTNLSVFLQVSCIMQSWFNRMISRFRVLLNKTNFGNEEMQLFTSWLSETLQMLSSLREAKVQSIIHLSYTALCPSCNLEQDFLQQAIASHLMTFGCSIVVGLTTDRINLVIHTLALFNWESERVCSRQVIESKQWPYAHDLYVQGILKNKDGSYALPIKELMYSKFPSTIIDVHKREIKQTSTVIDHLYFRHDIEVEELSQLYLNREIQSSFIGKFQSVDAPESLVKNLLDELHKLPVQNGIREAFVKHFMHLLQRRALTLIKHLEAETQFWSQPYRTGIRKLKHDLNLPLEGDFRIVLAAAEKLKPGLCHLLYSDRWQEADYIGNSTEV